MDPNFTFFHPSFISTSQHLSWDSGYQSSHYSDQQLSYNHASPQFNTISSSLCSTSDTSTQCSFLNTSQVTTPFGIHPFPSLHIFNPFQFHDFNHSYSSSCTPSQSTPRTSTPQMSAKKASKRQRTRISTHDVVKASIIETNSSETLSDTSDNTANISFTTSNVHTSNYLSEDAVSILNSWYYSHIEKPYPTSDQKSELAEQCGVSLKKVSTWFNNRRTRSNNTRPKQKIAELQRQVKILQEKTFL